MFVKFFISDQVQARRLAFCIGENLSPVCISLYLQSANYDYRSRSFNFRDSDMRGKVAHATGCIVHLILCSSDSAIKDLGRDLVNFAQKHNTATWTIQYFDRMYDDPSQPRSNASRLSGLVLYFCMRGTTDQGHDVSVTFVSILGVCVFSILIDCGCSSIP